VKDKNIFYLFVAHSNEKLSDIYTLDKIYIAAFE